MVDDLVHVGGVDSGLDLDRNRGLRSRTTDDSIGTASLSSMRSDLESWDVAQDPKYFGFKLQSYIYAYTFIYRHRK